MTSKDLVRLVSDVRDNLSRVYAVDTSWNDDRTDHPGSLLPPAASLQDIEKFEKKTLGGRQFPPLYRQFLQLHNGWLYFWEGFTLLGASGKDTKDVLDEYNEAKKDQAEDLRGDLGKLTPEKIAAWEADDESNIYLANQIPLGADGFGDLYCFDTRKESNDGEFPVVYWSLDSGIRPEKSHANFLDLLKHVNEAAPIRYKEKQKEAGG